MSLLHWVSQDAQSHDNGFIINTMYTFTLKMWRLRTLGTGEYNQGEVIQRVGEVPLKFSRSYCFSIFINLFGKLFKIHRGSTAGSLMFNLTLPALSNVHTKVKMSRELPSSHSKHSQMPKSNMETLPMRREKENMIKPRRSAYIIHDSKRMVSLAIARTLEMCYCTLGNPASSAVSQSPPPKAKRWWTKSHHVM